MGVSPQSADQLWLVDSEWAETLVPMRRCRSAAANIDVTLCEISASARDGVRYGHRRRLREKSRNRRRGPLVRGD